MFLVLLIIDCSLSKRTAKERGMNYIQEWSEHNIYYHGLEGAG